jgi:hypothetical protein
MSNPTASAAANSILHSVTIARSGLSEVDESFLDPNVIPKSGEAYFYASEGDWMMSGRRDATRKARAVIKGN